MATAGGFAPAFSRIEREKGVDLKSDAGRWQARAELCAVIEPWVAALTATEVAAALKKAGALWAPYQSFRELAASAEHVQGNPMFAVLDQPGIGRYPVAATPVQFGAFERAPPIPAPSPAIHTSATLLRPHASVCGCQQAERASHSCAHPVARARFVDGITP